MNYWQVVELQVCFNIWDIQVLICMYIMTKKQNVHFLKDLKAMLIFYIWTVLLIVPVNASYLAECFFFSWTNSTLGKSTLALFLWLLNKMKTKTSKKSEILVLWIIWVKVPMRWSIWKSKLNTVNFLKNFLNTSRVNW